MEMQVADYYRQNCCKKQAELLKGKEILGIIQVRKNVLTILCKELVKGTEKKELLELMKKQIASYQENWFDYPFLKAKVQNRDYQAVVRFLEWYQALKATALQSEVACRMQLKNVTLREKASLVVQMPSGCHRAFLLSFSSQKKTAGGKSVHTNISTDLGVMTVKAALEEDYPGVEVYSLSLIAKDDESAALVQKGFVVDKSGGNGYLLTFKNFQKGNSFLKERFYEKAEEAVATPLQKNCYSCDFHGQCHVKPLEREMVREQADSYRMPSFTDRQKEVIGYKDGAMLVCAGPGSGKTATLIGRIKALIDKGIDPAFILVVTFTKEAAKELKKRCLSFLKEYELPYISTLHSLCYDILKTNKEFLGKEPKVLGSEENFAILDTLTQAVEPLKGFSYGKKNGKNGLLDTLKRRMASYKSDREAFFLRYPEIDREQFSAFVQEYDAIVSERGLITFDEQISLTLWLLRKYPEVLETYQHLFQYIMVDEYQDVDKEQAELVYLLGAHGNVCVVGDDDQSIYGFRGGSPKYMSEFKEHFGAKVVILNDNFRSMQTIVSASNKLIGMNEQRIRKDLKANRKGGQPVTIVPNQSSETVENIIMRLKDEGIAYHDIAVLNFKNSTLEELERSLGVPCRLSKSTLVEDGFFRIAYDGLMAKMEGINEELLADYRQAAGLTNPEQTVKSGLSAPELRSLRETLEYLESRQGLKAGQYLKYLGLLYDMESTVSYEAVEQMIQDKHIETLESLYQTMKGMVAYGDETRIQYEEKDEVCLITSHDSKGKEFPVVILYDGDRYEGEEEDRRLLYVALTRAKDRLFVLCNRPTKTLLDIGNVDESFIKAG